MSKKKPIDKKTKEESIDYAEDVQELIALNEDIKIAEPLKKKVMEAPKDELLKIVKSVGSPITIESVEYYNEEFLSKNF